ncbi:MAG: T9SS type A sorting domain-containing protein, partial [Bacteroidia bacterium]
YTFNWLPSGPTTEDRTGLVAGTYSVQITDINGCTGTVTATVTQPTSPVSGTTVVTNVSCFGGSNGAINLTPTGGTGPYTFNWLPSGPTTEDRTGLTAGTYTVIITDNNGCTGTVTATVTQPTSPVSGTTVVTNVSCFGGSNGTINLTPTGGTGPYTFNWLPSGPTTEDRTGLTAGTYSVQITDLNGCTATNAFTVTQPSAISVTASAQTNVSCFGGNTGAASINAATGGAGGFTYNWTPGNPAGDGTISVTGLTTGTWTVTTTDANGCTATNAFTVTQPSSALSSASSASPILCNGGSATVTVTASGGTFPYTGEGTFTEVAGNYSYTVTDANGCISTTSVTITEPTVLASTSTASSILCNGGNATVTVTASGGTSPYTGEGTFTEVAGNYSYTVTDNNGCTSSTSVTITEPTVLASTSTATAIICNGGNATVTVTASGGTSPYTGEGTFTEVAGNYSYTVTDNNGCLTTTSVTIPEPTVLASTSTATSILCNGGNATVTVTASGGTSPYTGEGTFTEVAGNYSYTVTDNNGCTSSTSVTITEPTVLASTSTASSILCNGGNATVTVTASGGTFPYTGEGTFTEVAGNYSYTVTDANGCSNSTSVTITEPDVLSVSVNATVNPTTCSGTDGSIDIDVIGGTTSYSFLWSNNDTNEDLTNIAAGSYNVTVTDANGCTAITSAFVNDPGAPIVTVSLPIDTACGGTSGTITLSGESPAGGIWSGSTVSGNTFDPSAAGVGNHYITYTFTDANGCSASAVDSIFVDLCSGIETGVTTAWSLFPNPTNGALNIITTADLSSDVVVEVYSADGKLLTSENKQHSKIITLDMTVQPVGVYFIRITANEKVSMYRVVKI